MLGTLKVVIIYLDRARVRILSSEKVLILVSFLIRRPLIDRLEREFYSHSTQVVRGENMQYGDGEIRNLELRVDELIQICEQLQHENKLLRHKQAALIAERAKLVEKTELARTQVESMITRLRVMEHNA